MSEASLRDMGIGWHVGTSSYTLPMREVDGSVIGIRRRLPDGSKKCLPRSRLGIMTPVRLTLASAALESPDLLLICEGESDAAAALDMGFDAVARPGCEACRELAIAYVDRLRPGRVVLVADRDGPGQRGAFALAILLVRHGNSCRIFTPPDGAKDLRAWMLLPDSGHHALLALLEASAGRVEVLS